MALGLLAGCTTSSPEMGTDLDVPDSFSEAGVEPLPDAWWTSFGDERLSYWVDTALMSNFSLLAARDRLTAAQAVVRRERSGLFPTLDGVVSGESIQSDVEDTERIELGLEAAYEVDLWGRIRATADAEALRAQATEQDLQAAALTLSAETAQSWFQLITERQRIALLRRQLETNEKILQILQNRFEQGQTQAADVLRQQQLVEDTGQQFDAAKGDKRVAEHQLNLLAGRAPRRPVSTNADETSPQIAPLPETGVPGALIRRRPDVQSAWLELRAADRDVAAAVSDRFPRISLQASVSTVDEGAQALFDDWIVRLAGNLIAPVLDGGRRRAEVDRNRAIKMQRLNEYRQSVLVAFREVEDALAREESLQKQLVRLDERIRLADQTYQQLETQYINGAGDFIDALTSLTNTQQLRRDRLTAQLNLLNNRTGLYRALAGSIDLGETP